MRFVGFYVAVMVSPWAGIGYQMCIMCSWILFVQADRLVVRRKGSYSYLASSGAVRLALRRMVPVA